MPAFYAGAWSRFTCGGGAAYRRRRPSREPAMRQLLSILLLLSAATPLSATDLQMVKARPGIHRSGHDQQMAMLAPSLRDWVSVRSRALVDSGEEPDAAAIARDVNARLAGQDFSTADVEALVQLVMMESARQADADLRDMMEQMRATNQRKAEMRDMAAAQREGTKALADQTRAEYAASQPISTCAEPPCQPQLVLVK